MFASGAWLFVTASLVLASAAAFAAGLLWARQQRAQALDEAVSCAAALADAGPATLWRCDAAQQLQPLRWGGGAAAAGLSEGRLWQHFDADDGDAAALRDALERRTAFGPLRLRRTGNAGPGAGALWLLQARPRHDRDGRFAGHLGSARPAPDDAPAAGPVLDALLAASRAPLLVAAGGGSGDDGMAWQLRHTNPAAREHFSFGTALPPWETVRERLPEAVRGALDGLATDSVAEADGWRLQRVGAHLLLLAAPATSGADHAVASELAAFSYTVSHDLRAPIRVVEGFTRILKEDYGPAIDRVANDHLDRVLGAAARMNQMIDAMLTLARLSSQPLARQPVDLTQLAGYIVDELRRSAPERQADVEIEPGLVAQGDPTLLRVVLENLLGNAWKYTQRAPRARIVLASEVPPQPGRRGLVVRDNGAGFDMRSAERLFGLFQRLHSASEFPGTGVGLASVKRIVQRHGGEIWADAEPGRGAAFHLSLRD